MKPFLKWAGSKYKIIDRVLASLPKGTHLIEPFVGSGAVFLNAGFESNVVADSNADLINLYQHIQLHGNDFADYASSFFTPENNTQEQFYSLRDTFNSSNDLALKSALFIYLNRHCFNGLCRYNSKGKFNVPFGRYSKPAFPSSEISGFYEKSKHTVFKHADFETTLLEATAGSVVYCDPPYAPLTLTANFSSYTQDGFSMQEQVRLAQLAVQLMQQGIPVVISNHDTSFTRDLYDGAVITCFDVQRFISGTVNNRNKAAELLAVYG